MLKRLQDYSFGLSLRKQLAISFFIVPLLVGIFIYVAINNYSTQTLEASSFNLMRKSRDDLFGRIDAYLALPESIIQLNIALALSGILPLENEKALAKIFFNEVTHERSLDFLYYANEAGGITTVGNNEGKRLIATTHRMKKGDLIVTRVNERGEFVAYDKIVKDFDPRKREWYQSAKFTRKQIWSKPYAGSFEATLAISAAYPLIEKSGRILGVFGTDILLNTLAKFLHSLRISPRGYAYLVEKDGSVLASSTNALLFEKKGQELRRFNVNTSDDPLTREAAAILEKMKRSESSIVFSTKLSDPKGKHYYVDVSPYRYKDRISWFLITIVPRADFTQALDKLLFNFFLIMLFSLTCALVLSWFIGLWITRPILLIRDQARELSKGQFDRQVQTIRTDEIGQLAGSFNEMSTQLGTAYQELKIAKEEAESASRIKSEFLDIAAHELRTPLTPITLLIQRALKLTKEGRPVPLANLDLLTLQVHRLTNLMDDLLNIARLERGGLTLHPEYADLKLIVRECLDNFKERAPLRVITYNEADEATVIKLDSTRIYQVLSNLLDNALKYTPEDTPIEVIVTATPETVRVSVVDHGHGIPKKKQSELFSKFYRASTDATIRQPGLGLGLYISRRIIELHGGRIGLESEPERGSTFFFDLPKKEK